MDLRDHVWIPEYQALVYFLEWPLDPRAHPQAVVPQADQTRILPVAFQQHLASDLAEHAMVSPTCGFSVDSYLPEPKKKKHI